MLRNKVVHFAHLKSKIHFSLLPFTSPQILMKFLEIRFLDRADSGGYFFILSTF
jgi:hypothetical protein